ncbi:MAG: hypothetical protein JJT82_00870 [Legionellaceae bacterium]|nr:hypothetical protein [Legionellaceae bacterium]
MNKIRFSLCLLVSLVVTSTAVAQIPQAAIQDQQDDQARCIQERTSQCTSRCEKDSDKNDCLSLCAENATHECREAGE